MDYTIRRISQSSLSGKTVAMEAENDITVKGSAAAKELLPGIDKKPWNIGH